MCAFSSEHEPGQNLSHEQRTASWEEAKQSVIDRITSRGDLPYASVERQLEIVEQLSEFDFGRFLIEHGGLNGYWTHYLVTWPESVDKDNEIQHLNAIESFLLNSAPTGLATQQRYQIFKNLIQKRLKDGCSFASIPCGIMGDLLDLDYSSLDSFSLYGIDLDPKTLHHAQDYANKKGLLHHCQFFEKDAWNLNLHEQFDLIASNGLSIYEADDQKIVDLYRQFNDALKPGGILVTSFLTPPPAPGAKTEWLFEELNTDDALLQKILFVDVLEAKWQAYRPEEKVKKQLLQAGFSEIEVFYDKAHIFPTVIAKKPG